MSMLSRIKPVDVVKLTLVSVFRSNCLSDNALWEFLPPERIAFVPIVFGTGFARVMSRLTSISGDLDARMASIKRNH